jgi:cysteine-rich repeat protein
MVSLLTVNYFEKASASKRWFAHAEGSDTVIANATNEWVASCPASHFSLCGNGAIDAGEQCDDGNLVNGDGCNDACDNEARPSPSSRPEASSSSVLACFVCHHLLSAILGVAGQQS